MLIWFLLPGILYMLWSIIRYGIGRIYLGECIDVSVKKIDNKDAYSPVYRFIYKGNTVEKESFNRTYMKDYYVVGDNAYIRYYKVFWKFGDKVCTRDLWIVYTFLGFVMAIIGGVLYYFIVL